MNEPEIARVLMEFVQTIGFPGSLLIGLLYVVWKLGGRYTNHTIEMESKMQDHRISTENNTQRMLTHSINEFLEAHKQQSDAVVGIKNTLEKQQEKNTYGMPMHPPQYIDQRGGR